MKNRTFILKSTMSLMLLLLFCSCEKVIPLDLNSKTPQLVIEAEITNDTNVLPIVRISKSVNFDQSSQLVAVNGSSVKMEDNLGHAAIFSESSSGIYKGQGMSGVSGRTYFLTVTAEGKKYTSTCTMPDKVNFDSIQTIKNLFPGSTPDSKIVVPIYKDPVGRGNYYRFKIAQGQLVSTSILLLDDQIQDGNINNIPIADPTFKLNVGDSLAVDMMCISKAVRLYFYSLSQNASGPNASATPANPISNISNNALGYFSAHTLQTKKIKIQ
jgi:Domain of unknown function (DUF4249)